MTTASVESVLRASLAISVIAACGSLTACESAPDGVTRSDEQCRMVRVEGEAASLHLVLRIHGSGTAEESVLFEQVVDVALGAHDRLYVVDGGARTVWVFDREGRYLHQLGREGDGPGEFRYPHSAEEKADGTVLVVDASAWRSSLFNRDGELIDTHTLEPQAAIGTTVVEVTDTHDIYTAGYRRFGESVSGALKGRTRGLVRGPVDLLKWDSIGSTWKDLLELPGFEVFADVDDMSLVDVPYGGKALWAVGGDAVWYADNRSNVVRSANDDSECVELAGLAANPVTERQRDDFYMARNLAGASADRRGLIQQTRRGVELPNMRPMLAALAAGPDSSLWIKPYAGAADRPDDQWVVVDHADPDEAWLAVLPGGFRIHQVTSDIIIGSRLDDFDVPVVEVYGRSSR